MLPFVMRDFILKTKSTHVFEIPRQDSSILRRKQRVGSFSASVSVNFPVARKDNSRAGYTFEIGTKMTNTCPLILNHLILLLVL